MPSHAFLGPTMLREFSCFYQKYEDNRQISPLFPIFDRTGMFVVIVISLAYLERQKTISVTRIQKRKIGQELFVPTSNITFLNFLYHSYSLMHCNIGH